MSTPVVLLAIVLAAAAFGLGVWLGVRSVTDQPPLPGEYPEAQITERKRQGSWWHPVRAR
ncbi:hypothetical protein JK358_07490 [Nocardia sp. 2]|uniref:Uncharacterized protein n=1 Tax=Nocardia acididurans TaxID=2802282 RepID=A0ABS1M0P5_9NOCA|nr:hypothetical protein [Nocardia acididurans]MBL1074237.1 hypothetical protein [Nocardia acididurans]